MRQLKPPYLTYWFMIGLLVFYFITNIGLMAFAGA